MRKGRGVGGGRGDQIVNLVTTGLVVQNDHVVNNKPTYRAYANRVGACHLPSVPQASALFVFIIIQHDDIQC